MRWKRFLWGAGFLLIILISVAGYGLYRYQHFFDQIYDGSSENRQVRLIREEVPIGVGEATGSRRKEVPHIRPFTLLILGVDSRGESKSRSDTMMIAAINPARHRITLLSVPRDTRVKIKGQGYEKINHAMFIGGVPLVEKTLEEFLGIPIDRYITVDFEGFRRLIDSLGGIEINVKKRMKYRDPADGTSISLTPGLQVLNGEKALDYARYRKSDIARDDSDFDRIARQQEVVGAVVAKLGESLTIDKGMKLMEMVGRHVKTDLSKEELERLATFYYENRSVKIASLSLMGRDRLLPYKGNILYFFAVSEEERSRVRKGLVQSLSEEGAFPSDGKSPPPAKVTPMGHIRPPGE